jgi:hypothetical protein
MFNKNVFTQKDPIADIIKGINEADYKAKMEELKGNQHKIDKNKNNKIDAHDFKILRGEKKTMKEEEEVEESNNPFDVKNYKSQLKTKPGEKAGFDSKKVSTGTIYSRKPVKDEPMKKEEIEKLDELSVNKMLKYSDAAEKDRKKLNAKWDAGTASRKEQEKAIGREEGENRATNKIKKKTGKYPWELNREETEQAGREVPNCVPKNEEIDPNDTTTDTLKGREKTSGNPFLSKKVKMDVPDNVKEEAEQIDELTLSDLVARSRKQKFDTEAEMKHHRLVDGKPSVPKRVGSKDIHLHHIGTGNSTGENAKYKVVAAGAKSPLKAKVGSTISGKKVNDHMDTSGEGGTVHVHTARPKAHFMDDDMHEEVQHIDELSKDTLKSYSAKAKASAKSHRDAGNQYDSDPDERAFAPNQYKKAASRTAGAAKADSRIKEEAEQVEERTLTKGETSEKERIVKGMKKSLKGFKARYGDKAKSVMYATATKAAKKD